MSDERSEPLRIALVAEGPTDLVVIEAALKAILSHPFILTLLQPEPTQPKLEGGWCGVLKWCYNRHQRHRGPLTDDPILVGAGIDLVIIHLDVDVASKAYSDCASAVETWAKENQWGYLPCPRPCPPVSDTVNQLTQVIQSWLGQVKLGDRTILCLPAQASGTWIAAAILPPSHHLLTNAECNLSLEKQLTQLPKGQRIKKKREYLQHGPTLTQQWDQVKQICTQAQQFEQSVLATMKALKP